MNVVILILLFVSLAIVAGITFTVWKLTHLFLEQRGIKHTKLIAILVCIFFLALIYWLNFNVSDARI